MIELRDTLWALWRRPPTALTSFVLVALLLPSVGHWLYSAYGFNASDDGFVLAAARRVLEGEVPHRDLIWVRPLGSALLHLPEVWLGGSHVFWWARWVVWLQFGVITWAWLWALVTVGALRCRYGEMALLAVIGLAGGLHHFPLMPWHSIDALFLASLGVGLAFGTRHRFVKILAFACVGAALVCRQGFGLVAPALLLATGEVKRPRYWLAAAAPGLAYVVWVVGAGGYDDLMLQLLAWSGSFRDRGIWDYWRNAHVAWGLVAGVGAAAMAMAPAATPLRRAICKAFAALLLTACLVRTLGSVAEGEFVRATSYLLFGVVAGLALQHAWQGQRQRANLEALAVLCAWSVSLSLGWASPALGTGALALVVWAELRGFWRHDAMESSRAPSTMPAASRLGLILRRASFGVVLLGVAVVAAARFHRARTQAIYRELTAAQLTAPLGPVLPGGDGIVTNANNAALLADLQRAVTHISGRRYILIPDFAAWWVTAAQANPLPLDWPIPTEIPGALHTRALQSLAQWRGKAVVILQKVRADRIATVFEPVPDNYSPLVRMVRTQWQKSGETEYFEFYE